MIQQVYKFHSWVVTITTKMSLNPSKSHSKPLYKSNQIPLNHHTPVVGWTGCLHPRDNRVFLILPARSFQVHLWQRTPKLKTWLQGDRWMQIGCEQCLLQIPMISLHDSTPQSFPILASQGDTLVSLLSPRFGALLDSMDELCPWQSNPCPTNFGNVDMERSWIVTVVIFVPLDW